MQNLSFGMLLLIALAWGIRHAFDADHIMAVTGFNVARSAPQQQSYSNFMAFCLHWSIGHGGMILIVGVLVLLLGMAIPVQLALYAEYVCAALLLLIGLVLLIGCGNRQRVHSHQPNGHFLTQLSHVTQHFLQQKPKQSALTVGLVHGLSGSAVLLALVPMANLQSAWLGLLYLLSFSLGVSAGMAVIALSLNYGYRRWVTSRQWLLRLRLILGLSSLCYGIFMLTDLS